MECNKDEAIRAKDIAERKLTSRDYSGAKKFALKAQNLYPGLEGLSQMLMTIEIYISADNKIKGEVDWYGILGVNPLAEDETIKKEYRKLALALHPDKNKSVGADGAFKIVSEAWSLLSDKAKRSAYDQRRNLRGFHEKVPSKRGGDSSPFRVNDFHRYTSRPTSYTRTQHSAARATATTSSQPFQKNSFWTICNGCKTHYEYLKLYINQTLLCPSCKTPFLAKEITPPAHVSNSSHFSSDQECQGSNHEVAGKRRDTTVSQNWNAYVKMSASLSSDRRVSKSNNGFEQEGPMKRSRVDDNSLNGYGGDMARRYIFETGSNFGVSSTFSVLNIHKDFSSLDIRTILMMKAKMEIRKKLKEWSSTTKTKDSVKGKKRKDRDEEKQQSTVGADTNNLDRCPDSANITKENQDIKSSGVSTDNTNQEADENMSMKVPDPDFYNFDMDRSEISFRENEVWAAYDDDDGMPRYYALIHKVISTNPFKMKISWLNSRSNGEFGPLSWVGSGFSKTCGEFRVGRHEFNKSLNSFSHKIEWSKGTRGVINIYPRKGDVWALYRNWSTDWNKNTPDEVVHKYDLVEVLDDYDEEQGVSVIPLIKVSGFRTVFHRHAYPKEVRRIVKEEMFRFSHQVPNYLITGQESPRAPKDCRELDPAAMPVELLQVITNGNETAVMGNGGIEEILIDEQVQNGQQSKRERNEHT